MLVRLLSTDGYEIDLARDGQQGLRMGLSHRYGIAVVDRKLPVMDGLDLVVRLRRRSVATRVLMLTALGSLADRVHGLDAGADDYLSKPFEVAELRARVRALSRRSYEPVDSIPLGAGSLEIAQRAVRLPDGAEVALTAREFDLIRSLALRPLWVHSRHQLRRQVFQEAALGVHRGHLRPLSAPQARPGGRPDRARTGLPDRLAVIGLAGSLEQRVLRRARIVVAVNLAAAVGLVVLLVSGIAFLVSANQQDTATQRYVGFALGQDSGGIKYACLWLFTMPAGQVPYPPIEAERIEGAATAPPGFPLLGPMVSVAAGGPTAEQTVVGSRTVYLVRTVRVGSQVRQAVFDLAYQRDNNRQLVVALMTAGLAGLAVAVALGLVLSRRAVRPLEEALDRQQRFVTDASHELRAPITRLHTRAQLLLLAEADLPAAVVDDLRKMVRGTGELTEVVDDLLRSARLRAGAQPADRVDLVALIDELLAAEAGRLQSRQVSTEVHAGPGLPAVAGVESSLRRMLSVLVDNAIGQAARRADRGECHGRRPRPYGGTRRRRRRRGPGSGRPPQDLRSVRPRHGRGGPAALSSDWRSPAKWSTAIMERSASGGEPWAGVLGFCRAAARRQADRRDLACPVVTDALTRR